MLGFIEIVWGQFHDDSEFGENRTLIDMLYNIEDGYVVHGGTVESFDKAVEYLKAWDYGEAEEIIWDLSSKIGSNDDVIYRDAEGNVWGFFNTAHPPVPGSYLITANPGLGDVTFWAVIDSEGQAF
jgi:hypothetical protein